MNAQEFFYWLQGYIELSKAAGAHFLIGPNVASCITAHSNLVPEAERGERLIEVRTLAKMAARAGSAERTQSLTDEIVEVVAATFLHIIDPKAGDESEQARLNLLHNSHLTAPAVSGKPVMRC